MGSQWNQDEGTDTKAQRNQQEDAELHHLSHDYKCWRLADPGKAKEEFTFLLGQSWSINVLKGMPSLKLGKMRMGNPNTEAQHNYMQALLDGTLASRNAKAQDKAVVHDLTRLVLNHYMYRWVDLPQLSLCLAKVHDELVPVNNKHYEPSDDDEESDEVDTSH